MSERVMLGVRVEESVRRRVKAEAASRGVSVQELMLVAVEEYLKKEPEAKPARSEAPAGGSKPFVGPFPKGGKR